MTYFKLHIRLLIVDFIVILLLFVILPLLFTRYTTISSAIPLTFLCFVFLVDGIFITLWKKDLFSERYHGTASYIFFKGRRIVDLSLAGLLLVLTIRAYVLYGIGS